MHRSDIKQSGGDLHFVGDFLQRARAPSGCNAVVTNPPYRLAAQFAEHALSLVPDVYLLLRLAFLESVSRTELLNTPACAACLCFENGCRGCTGPTGMGRKYPARWRSLGCVGDAITPGQPLSHVSSPVQKKFAYVESNIGPSDTIILKIRMKRSGAGAGATTSAVNPDDHCRGGVLINYSEIGYGIYASPAAGRP
jgi:hypothetical protein